jgi:hypothetical protein
MKGFIATIVLLPILTGCVARSQNVGPGCSTATMIDNDCDGFGVGSPNGPDADDSDPGVNTPATVAAKFDNLSAFLSTAKKYSPRHIVFIATNGNDRACSMNDEKKPCATYTRASSMMAPGDAVIWRAGSYTYKEALRGKGGKSASAPSIYMAYPGEAVTLVFKGTDGIDMGGLSYWIIDGLKLVGGSTGYGVSCFQAFKIYDVVIRNTEVLGFYDGLFIQNGLNHLTIQNSYIHNDTTHLGQEHNVYLGCSALTCPNLVFQGNIIADSPAGGHNLHINGRFPNALVENNTFYGAIGNCLALQMGVSNSLFQNNTCHTAVSAAIWLIDYHQTSNPSIGCYNQNYNTFRNNTFIADGQSWNSAINGNDGSQPVYRVTDQCAQNPGTHDLGHNAFENNIFVHWCSTAAKCPYGFGPVLIYDGPQGPAWLKTDTWRNNLLWNVGNDSAIVTIGGMKHDWSWFASPENAPLASGNIEADPKFVAADPAWSKSGAQWNLKPSPDSPAIHRGGAGEQPQRDIRGIPRGPSIDAGAYQSDPAKENKR